MAKKEEKTKITSRSTKTEIMEAYEAMRKKTEELSKSAPASKRVEQKIQADEKKTVEKASTYTIENIVKNLADINLYVNKSLGELSEKLTHEASKLHEIKSAIEIEKRHLEEVHDIRVSADALSLLIQEYDAKKKAFEEESTENKTQHQQLMRQMREEWKKEQSEYEAIIKERDAKAKKEREREREEYEYNLKLARKKDKDAYELKKAVLERELKEERAGQEKEFFERETDLAEREAELTELRKKSDAFQSVLDKAVKQAEKEAAATAEQKAEITAKLFAKGKEAEIKLLELKNLNLEAELNKQTKQIEALMKQLSEANSKVLAIATKAIEGASGAKTLTTVREIALEQAKQPKPPN